MIENRTISLFLPLSLPHRSLEGEGYNEFKWIGVWSLSCSL